MELVIEELISCNEELEEETENLENKLEEKTKKLNLYKQKQSKLKTGAGFLLAFDGEKTAYKFSNWSSTWGKLNPSNSTAMRINDAQYTYLGIMRERCIIEKDQDGKKRLITTFHMVLFSSSANRNLTLVSLNGRLHAIEIGSRKLVVHQYNDINDTWTSPTWNEVNRCSASNLGDSIYAINT